MSGANRSSPLRYFVWVLCVRACIVRVSENLVRLRSLVFHYWLDGLLVPAATGSFAIDIRRITADRDWVVFWVDNGTENFCCSSLEPVWDKLYR